MTKKQRIWKKKLLKVWVPRFRDAKIPRRRISIGFETHPHGTHTYTAATIYERGNMRRVQRARKALNGRW